MMPVPGDVVCLSEWSDTIYTHEHDGGIRVTQVDMMLVIAIEQWNDPIPIRNLFVLTRHGLGWIFSNLVRPMCD